MNVITQLDRRNLLRMLSTLPFTGLPLKAVAETRKSPVLNYLRSLMRPDGGYAWPDDPGSALPTTYAALACYRFLGEDPPAKTALAQYVRTSYPQILMRIGDSDPHPMHQFDYEQVQCLLWLGEPVDGFIPRPSRWVKPDFYPDQFEPDHVPVFQQEVYSILCRQLLGIASTDEWNSYVLSRRRDNGSFNSTPAQDGSDGHVSNTLWGILALQAIGHAVDKKQETVEWVRSCQIESRFFTYSPDATLAANDHVAYVWAAVKTLKILGTTVRDPEGARSYLGSLGNEDGGFGDRPGRASNPMATMQALEALSILGSIETSRPRRAAKRQSPVPDNLNVYTIQIEAPGIGSPQVAVDMAKALKVDLWGAKNSKPGWIEASQKLAETQNVPVKFFVANEEYGTTIIVPGLGTYSHLADITAPAGSHFGAPLTEKSIQPIPWPQFLTKRIDPLRSAGGSNVWQYNQNEALSRVLLDQAVQSGTFSAISTFHFSDNFLETTPFLNRYRDVMPFIALQDAHVQTWWWMEHLVGFRTLFLAEAPPGRVG
jgi:prenyltransferase beta subunit